MNWVLLLFGVVGFIATVSKKKENDLKKQFKQLVQKPSLTNAWELSKIALEDDSEEFDNEDEEVYEDEYFEDTYEDEEAYETELLTPMSEEVDAGQVYSQQEWQDLMSEDISQSVSRTRRLKHVPLKQAFIYSEIFGKPKGLERK